MFEEVLERPTALGPKKIPSRSPFRYPGGKGFFAYALAEMIAATPDIKDYAEPYAGGASAALHLLASGSVKRIFLNDADPRIYAAWTAILHRNEEFVERLESISINMDTWHKCLHLVLEPTAETDAFELGLATFFLNRTNRSGIILGAGPIGGYAQAGKWKVDARFYRDTMIQRVRWLGQRSEFIHVSNLDGLTFIKRCWTGDESATTFLFIDPPYVAAGSRLYLNGMDEDGHRQLGEFFQRSTGRNWAMTYDDCPLIREIYAGMHIENLAVTYSLQHKRKAAEVLIRPPSLV